MTARPWLRGLRGAVAGARFERRIFGLIKWAQLGLNQGDPWTAVDGPAAVCAEVQEKAPLAALRLGDSGDVRTGLRVDEKWTGLRQGSYGFRRDLDVKSPRSRDSAAAGGLVTEHREGRPAGVDEAGGGGKREVERAVPGGAPQSNREVAEESDDPRSERGPSGVTGRSYEPGGADREPPG